MIRTKEDLKLYLQKDKESLAICRKSPRIVGDEVWKFQIFLRKHEYYFNNRTQGGILGKLLYYYYKYRHHQMGIKLGFDIPINVFGKGLRINHYGYIVVNPRAKIGDFCDIHQGVHIGRNLNNDDVPEIGDNVWIGPGAKLFGKIKLGNNIMVGAGSVVNRSFEMDNVTIAGVPAKIVKQQKNPWIRY